MLIITRSDGMNLTHTLKVEGKLLASWIGELESACGASRAAKDEIRLDLCDVTYVDAEGARYLSGLIREGARVVACSGFVAELLQLRGPRVGACDAPAPARPTTMPPCPTPDQGEVLPRLVRSNSPSPRGECP